MKSLKYILIGILGIVVFWSCDDDFEDPVLNLQNAQPPQLDIDFSELILEKADSTNQIVFNWTPADYKSDNVADPFYGLQMKRDTAQSEYFELTSTDTTSYSISVAALNSFIQDKEIELGVAFDYKLRVISLLTDDDSTTCLYSDPVDLSILTYTQELIIDPIYILGDGTPAGWDNQAAIEMSYLEDGKFIDTIYLDPAGGPYMKFISVLGQWAPQYGTDDTGDSESGPLVRRDTESDPDPAAIPIPDVAGDYIVTADTVNLAYTITPATKSMKMRNGGSVVDMEQVKSGVFAISTTLENGMLEFVEFGGTNSTWFVSSDQNSVTVHQEQAKAVDYIPNAKYRIVIDLEKRNLSITQL